MKAKQLIALAIVTVAFAAGAVYLTLERQAEVTTSLVARKGIFAGLIERINDVNEIEVRDQKATVRIVRKGDQWIIPKKDDHPAEFEKVKKFLVQMGEVKALEPRTSKPELYGRLRVNDVDENDSRSILLTLKNASGEVMAELIQGKSLVGLGLAEKNEIYVRKLGEAQSWLAWGLDFYHADSDLWIDKNVINIERHRIRQMTNTPTEGEILVIHRPSPEDDDMVAPGLPEGAKVDKVKLNDIGGALEWLTFSDVMPRNGIDELKPGGYARYETFDGLTVDVALHDKKGKTEIEDETWVTIDADFNAAKVSAQLTATEAVAPTGGQTADKSDAKEEKVTTPEDASKQAEEVAKRVSGWAYKFPDWKVEIFKRGLEGILIKDKPAAQKKSGP